MMNALPNIAFIQICEYLDPSDVISLERVSRESLRKTQTLQIWKSQFQRQGGVCHIKSMPWLIYKKACFLCKIMNAFKYRKRLLIVKEKSNKKYQINLIAL